MREAERRRAFCVRSLGYNRCAAKLDYSGFQRRHPRDRRFSSTSGRTLESVVLVHIASGHGMFRSRQSGVVPVPANSIFFVFPGVNHYYRYDDETGWDEEWLELEPSGVLPILADAGITSASPLRTFAAVPTVTEAFQTLLDASRNEKPGAKLLVEAAAHRVLAEAVVAWSKGDADTVAARAVEKMRQTLVSDITHKCSVADAARAAGMSESHMRDLFTRATGLSPKKYQMRARLVRAGKLLRGTDLPVASIAEQTGFDSVFAFSRRFSKLLGCSPRDYRNNKRKKQ